MRKGRSLTRLLVSLATFVATAQPATAANDAPRFREIIGRVLEADGTPSPGALVKARINMNSGLLGTRAPLGMRIPSPPIATAVTGDDGRFTMSIPALVPALALARANGGWLRTTLSVTAGICPILPEPDQELEPADCWGSHTVGRARGAYTEVREASEPTVTPLIDEVVGFVGMAEQTAREVQMTLETVNYRAEQTVNALTGEPGGEASTPEGEESTAHPCDRDGEQETLVADTFWLPVGELHTYSDTWAKFWYGKVAESEFGIGIRKKFESGWTVHGGGYVVNRSSNTTDWPAVTKSPNKWAYQLTSRFYWQKNRYYTCWYTPKHRLR